MHFVSFLDFFDFRTFSNQNGAPEWVEKNFDPFRWFLLKISFCTVPKTNRFFLKGVFSPFPFSYSKFDGPNFYRVFFLVPRTLFCKFSCFYKKFFMFFFFVFTKIFSCCLFSFHFCLSWERLRVKNEFHHFFSAFYIAETRRKICLYKKIFRFFLCRRFVCFCTKRTRKNYIRFFIL